MMKRYLILTMALATVAIGCRKNNPNPSESTTAHQVTIESTFNDQTQNQTPAKASRAQEFDNFADGAKVGLFMVDFTAAATQGTLKNYERSESQADGNSAHNVLYIASGGVLSTMPAVHYTKDLAFNVDLFAYYPHSADYGKSTVSMIALPFSVLTDQRKAEYIASSDLCWAKTPASGVKPSPNAVSMQFYHKTAKIKVVLIIPATVSGKTFSSVTNMAFQDIKTDITFDMSTGETTLISTNTKIITPLELGEKEEDGANFRYTYEMIAPAQQYAVGGNLLSFEVNFSDGTKTTIPYQVSAKMFDTYATTSQAGMIHNLRLTLGGNAEILLTGSDIEPWITAPTITSDLTNKITTRFSIATTYTTANRVKVTTDEAPTAKIYDIKASDVAGSVNVASGVCTFYFTEKSSSPYDYGFKITKLEFFNTDTSLGSMAITSPRVYSTTTFTLTKTI